MDKLVDQFKNALNKAGFPHLPIPDFVWAKITEKFTMPLRYTVPGTGGTYPPYQKPKTGQPGFTKWHISPNVNFAPNFLVYDSASNTYEFKNKIYQEQEFLEELDKMTDNDIKEHLDYLQEKSNKELSELLKNKGKL